MPRLPGRRAGIGQILLNDLDEAVADVHWIADHGLMGGVLLPGVPPGSGIDPLHSPTYDPVWRACEERGVVLNMHGGSGSPDIGMFPASPTMFVLEASFYAHRPLWSLVLSGVFDRFPRLKLVFAEAGSGWVANTLAAMDTIQAKIEQGNVGVMPVANPLVLQHKPSDYWRRNCWLGSSFMTRGDADDRAAVGTDRIMWGSDFPHDEGTFPYTRRIARPHLRRHRGDRGGRDARWNCRDVYGFDLDRLRPIADRIGPEVAAVHAGLAQVPDDATTFAFGSRTVGVS